MKRKSEEKEWRGEEEKEREILGNEIGRQLEGLIAFGLDFVCFAHSCTLQYIQVCIFC